MTGKTIRFTSTQTVKRQGKPDLVYEEGSVHTLREDRANRWLRRGVAVEVKPEERTRAPVTTSTTTAHTAAPGAARTSTLPATGTGQTNGTEEAKNDGDAMGGSAPVSGANSSGARVGTEPYAGRGRGGSRGGRAGGGDESKP